jgi:hypothetical protein
MPACGTCRHNAVPTRTPAPLLQIKSGLRARWNTIEFLVEADSGQWTLRVRNSASSEVLYTAHRGGSRAAQSAAVEFAIFRVLGSDSRVRPEQLAKELIWQAYW